MAVVSPLLKTKNGKILADAIKNLHPISFWYSGPKLRRTQFPWRNPVKSGNRVKCKPVAIGISKQARGALLVRVHISFPSVSRRGIAYNKGWRTFIVGSMTSLKIHKDEKFSLSIPGYNGGGTDKSFRQTLLYITPESAKANTKTKFQLQREEYARKKQEREFEKMAKQRKKKAAEDLKKKNRKA